MKTEQEFIREYLYSKLKEYEDTNTYLGYSGAMNGFYDLKPIKDIIEICEQTGWKIIPTSHKKAYEKFKQKYLQKEKEDLQEFERLSEKYNKVVPEDKIEIVKHNIQKIEEPKYEYLFCPRCGSNRIIIQKENKTEATYSGCNWPIETYFNDPYHLSCYSCGHFAKLFYETIHFDDNGYFITMENKYND